jgi:uncharacterized glyoxalase superfamily protein PhnB
MTEQARTSQEATVLGGLTPYISVDGATKASEFYQKAFGAMVVFQYPPDAQGRTMHIHLHVNGSSMMLCDFYPESGHHFEKPAAFTMQLHYTADTVDAAWKRAVDAGCTVEMPLQDMFWGDRWGSMQDPFGVRWAMNVPVKQG